MFERIYPKGHQLTVYSCFWPLEWSPWQQPFQIWPLPASLHHNNKSHWCVSGMRWPVSKGNLRPFAQLLGWVDVQFQCTSVSRCAESKPHTNNTEVDLCQTYQGIWKAEKKCLFKDFAPPSRLLPFSLHVFFKHFSSIIYKMSNSLSADFSAPT